MAFFVHLFMKYREGSADIPREPNTVRM
uniref:FRS9 n=1 Tax=Arundo donax TaxID=35708 RepID=A0A0A9GYY6_ARUDO